MKCLNEQKDQLWLMFSKCKSLKIDEVTFIIKYNYKWKLFPLFTLFSRSNIENIWSWKFTLILSIFDFFVTTVYLILIYLLSNYRFLDKRDMYSVEFISKRRLDFKKKCKWFFTDSFILQRSIISSFLFEDLKESRNLLKLFLCYQRNNFLCLHNNLFICIYGESNGKKL